MTNGIDTAAQATAVEISPADASAVFVGTDGAGIYESLDGGVSFEPAGESTSGMHVDAIVASPLDSERAFALSDDGDLFLRTSDGWESTDDTASAVAYSPDDSGPVVRSGDDGNVDVSDDDGTTWNTTRLETPVSAVAVLSDGAILAGLTDGTLMRSQDQGRSFAVWHRIAPSQAVVEIHETAEELWIVGADSGPIRHAPANDSWTEPGTGLTTDAQASEPQYAEIAQFDALGGEGTTESPLFHAAFDGLFRSTDRGQTWQEIDTLATTIVGYAISPAFESDQTILLTTYVAGSYRSVDGGLNWQPIGTDLALSDRSTRLFNVVLSPAFADDGIAFTGTIRGTLRSSDRGTTWEFIDTDAVENDPGSNRIDITRLSPAFPTDGHVFVATLNGGLLVSDDHGATFELRAQFDGWPNSLVVSPGFEDDTTLFVGVRRTTASVEEEADYGVWRSRDAGSTWEPTGLSAGVRLMAISPSFADDRTLFATTNRDLYVSNDGGDRWRRISPDAVGESRLDALAVSPNFADDQTVLISVRGRGLFRSTDGGSTFSPIAREVIGANFDAADFVKPTAQPVQFSPRYSSDGTIFVSAGSSLVVSVDRGDSWMSLPRPDGATGNLAQVLLPDDDSRGSAWVAVLIVGLVGLVVVGGFVRRARAAPKPHERDLDHGTID